MLKNRVSKTNLAILHKSCIHFSCHSLGQDTHNHHRVLDAKHQKYSERYDEMIHAFAEWESQLVDTSGEGRQLDVLRGCFVGAKNEYVVEALRIVYVDYPPLRVAGNLIFKLMSSLIKSRQ